MNSELEAAEQRLSIFEGLVLSVDRRTEVLEIVSNSPTVADAHRALSQRLGLTEIQAQAVLDLQVRRLAVEERAKLVQRVEEIKAYVAELRS